MSDRIKWLKKARALQTNKTSDSYAELETAKDNEGSSTRKDLQETVETQEPTKVHEPIKRSFVEEPQPTIEHLDTANHEEVVEIDETKHKGARDLYRQLEPDFRKLEAQTDLALHDIVVKRIHNQYVNK